MSGSTEYGFCSDYHQTFEASLRSGQAQIVITILCNLAVITNRSSIKRRKKVILNMGEFHLIHTHRKYNRCSKV